MQGLDHAHDLGNAVEPDDQCDKLDAQGKIRQAQRKSILARHCFLPDRAEHQAERHRENAGCEGAARNARKQQQTARRQREELGRPEHQAELRKCRGEEHHADDRQHAAEKRSGRDDGEHGACPALLRHFVAVDARDDRSRFARHVHQDRGRRAAVHGAVKDAGHHDEPAGGIQRVAQRQDHRDARGRSQTGKNADQRSGERADERGKQVVEGKGNAQSVENPVQRIHRVGPLARSKSRPRAWAPSGNR